MTGLVEVPGAENENYQIKKSIRVEEEKCLSSVDPNGSHKLHWLGHGESRNQQTAPMQLPPIQGTRKRIVRFTMSLRVDQAR